MWPADGCGVRRPRVAFGEMEARMAKSFFLVILDHDNKQLSVEGPIEDDTRWIMAVDAAQQAGRDVTCVRGDGIDKSAIAESAAKEFRYGLAAGSIVTPAIS
jgi:hypothetical protein